MDHATPAQLRVDRDKTLAMVGLGSRLVLPRHRYGVVALPKPGRDSRHVIKSSHELTSESLTCGREHALIILIIHTHAYLVFITAYLGV